LKTALVSVINDLSTDERVHKICCTLQKLGYEVTLIGRKQRNSLPLAKRNYSTIRMNLLFEKGSLFYIEFQLRLFLLLAFKKADVLFSNDLDTLLPNYLISKIKKKIVVYDTHELFCEVPELMNRPLKKRIWKTLEKRIFPKLKYVFTVNNSIAAAYLNEYHVPVHAVRNVPFLSKQQTDFKITRTDLGITDDKKIIVLQGAGINMDRGAEEAIQAMHYLNDAVLIIIGSGNVIDTLKQMTMDLKLQHKITFINKLPFEQLVQYTKIADIGISLDKDTNMNYRYSLPNKLFDYIHAGIPVITSDLIEVRTIVNQYNIGTIIQNHSPQHIAQVFTNTLKDTETLFKWKQNTIKAAAELNWEKEEKIIMSVFEPFNNANNAE